MYVSPIALCTVTAWYVHSCYETLSVVTHHECA